MYLHLFKCARQNVFAATPDSRGSNLPPELCRDGWKYIRGVTVMPADRPSLMLDPESVLAGVTAKGYHVWGPGVPSSEQGRAEPERQQDDDHQHQDHARSAS
jgi:hypothetical protein